MKKWQKCCKNISSKYSQKRLDYAAQSSTDGIKIASKKKNWKTAEATEDLIGNKIGDKVTRVSKASRQNNSETNDKEILRARYISPEKRQQIINDLRLI